MVPKMVVTRTRRHNMTRYIHVPLLSNPKRLLVKGTSALVTLRNVKTKGLLTSSQCPGCLSENAAKLHEGWPAVCGLWVRQGRGDGGGRGEGACQCNKQDKVRECFILEGILSYFCTVLHEELLTSFVLLISAPKKVAVLGACLGCWRAWWGLRAWPVRTWSQYWIRWGTTSSVWYDTSLLLLIFCNVSKCIACYSCLSFLILAAKNVAAEIASQLCDSVAKKLEGKVMGTFTST